MADLGDKTCFTTSRRRCGFVFTSTLAAASCASSESLTPDSVTNRGLMEKSPKPHGNFMANLDTWNHLCMKSQILYTAVVSNKRSVKKLITKIKIKGPENPTRQLLPIMSTKCCSGDGERRKDKGCGGGPPSKTKLGAHSMPWHLAWPKYATKQCWAEAAEMIKSYHRTTFENSWMGSLHGFFHSNQILLWLTAWRIYLNDFECNQ